MAETNAFSDLIPAQDDKGNAFDELIPKGGAISNLADVAKNFKAGVEQLPGTATGIADLPFALAGKGRPISEAANVIGEQTGFQPGKWAEQAEYSPHFQQEQKEIGKAWEPVDAVSADQTASPGDYIRAAAREAPHIAATYLTNPLYSVGQLAQSLPSMFAAGALSRPLMVAGRTAGVGTGTLERAAGKAAAPIAGGISEGGVQTGQQMQQGEGLPDQQRNAVAALGSGVIDALIAGGVGHYANTHGWETAQTKMAKLGDKTVDTEAETIASRARRIALGGLSEGVGQELPQSAQEQAWQNYAEGKPLGQGVLRQGIEGSISGIALGAGANLTGGHHNASVTPNEQNDPSASVPPGPAQVAVEAGKMSGAIPGGQEGEPPKYGGVRGLIAEAAQRNGVDPATALTIAAIETGGRFNADAKNPKSSASGVFQFMDATRKMFPEVTPEMWQDPQVQAEYGAKFIAATNARMQQTLGRAPTPGEAYMGHLLGAYGATSLITADPNAKVQDVVAQYDPKRAAEIVRLNGMKGLTAGEAVQKWNDIAQRAGERLALEQQAFPFADQQAAQMRATAAAREGQMLEVVEHPNVPGRYAALPPLAGDPNEAQPASKVPLIADLPRYDEAPQAPQAPEAVQSQPQAAAGGGLAVPGEQPVSALGTAQAAEVTSADGRPIQSVAGTGAGVPAVGGAVQTATGALPHDAGAVGVRGPDAASAPVSPAEQAALRDELQQELISRRGLVPGVDYNHQPTPGQIEAGNYKKVHESWSGLPLTIENPAGSTRTAKDGSWSVDMQADYGYIKRTRGADSDPNNPKAEQIDFYRPMDAVEGAPVYVIDQIDPATGNFDEHKAILGVTSKEQAELLYDQHFEDNSGPQRRVVTTEMSMPQFKAWLKSGTTDNMPATVAQPIVQDQQAVKAGVLPEAATPQQGLFDSVTAAVKWAADNGVDARPVAAEGGYALAPRLKPQELTDDDARRVAGLNSALASAGFAQVAPVQGTPSPDVALAAHVAEQAFGKKVIAVEPAEGFSGVAYQDRIYLSASEAYPTLAVAGHELAHSFEGTPLHDKLRAVFEAYSPNAEAAIATRQQQEQATDQRAISKDYARNEVIADLNGSMWIDPKFWGEMAARDESLFRQVAYKFMALATKAVKVATGGRFDASAIVRDVGAARAAIAQAWSDHLNDRTSAAQEGALALAKDRTVEVDGQRRSDTNSQGQLIHPTFKGQVNFHRWFGESKVVDDKGRPLVVYHGTRGKEPIEAFSTDKTGSNTDPGFMGRGFYFGDGRTANAYAGHFEFDPEHFPQGGSVYPVYLALRNPVRLYAKNEGNRLKDRGVLAREAAGLPKSATSDEVRAKLEEMGHDGVIYKDDLGYSEYVAFRPEQIKSATGNNGDFSPKNSDIRFAKEKPDDRTAQAAPTTRAQGLQERSSVRGGAGEVRLDRGPQQGPGEDAPEKLYGVYEGNGRGRFDPHYPEWVYDDMGPADEKAVEMNDEAFHDLETSYRDDNERTLSDFEDEAEAEWDGNDEDANDSKFETYSLPGGVNYREVLLTLGDVSPDGQFSSAHWDQKNVIAHVRLKDRFEDAPKASWSGTGAKVLFVEEIQSDWAQEGREEGFKREPTPEEQEKIDEAMRVYAQRKQAVEEARNKLEVARDIYRELDHQLVDAQAKRGPELDRVAERHNEMSAKVNELLEKMDDAIYQQRVAEREVSELNKPINGVARAPFVDKTDKWVELALKRIIRMAAEEGYDKVAFATGQQNADRYDLQQEVEKIVYTKNSDDRWHVAVYGNGHGSRLIVNETMDEAKIKATLGQELTQKIVNDKGQRYDLQIQRPVGPDNDTGSGVISGLDLKMGGEGMLTFYDSIIPKALGRILPKLGGDKQLEKVTLSYPKGARNSASGRDVPHEHLGFAVNDKMRISAMGGLPLFMKNPIELKSITVPEIKGRIKGKWTDLRSVLLQSLGGRQIAEVYGRDLPQLPQYQKLVQLMQAGVNDIAAKADTVANEWGKLKDEKPLAGLMHDATLAQMDPAKPYVPGDSESQYRELRARWDQLSPKAQQVYAQARDMYEGHYAEVRQAIRDRIERAEGLSTPKKSEMLKRMDGEFFERIKGVYFPLARFGDYVVVVRDQDGKTAAVSRAETKAEADALRRDLKGEFGAGYTVSAVVKAAEFNAKRDAVGSEFLSTLFKVLDETGIGEDLQDEINQLVLTSMPDLSWAKHGIHRKGTAGFSQDARRAFANNMFHGSRYLQRVRYGDRLEGKLAEAERYVKGRAELTESVKEQQVLDEMRKRHELLMNPVTHPWATNLTSFGFLFHLGLAPASALVNVSQTPLIAGPILAGKFGARAYAALGTASVDTMKAKNNVVAALKGDEQRAVQKAIDEGTIDVTLAQDLAGIAQGNDTNLAWKMRPVMRAAAFLFHHAERFNRQATFLAAYRLARSAGASHEAAFDTATDLTYAGHFDYASSNRPRVMQGNVAKVVTQFKQYSQNMTYTLVNSVRLSLKGDRQAMKTLGGLLVMSGMAAGALGVPLVAQLFSLASMIGGSDDEPWDAKAALQNYLADAFGQKPAEVLMHGVSRLGPADISGRVSLDLYKMWFPDVNEALEGQAAYESFLAGMLGPVIGGVGVNTAKAFALISDGEWEKAMELILPLSPLRSGMKAYRFAEEGARDKSGVPIKDEVSAAGIASQAIGFRPSEVANAQEGRGVVMELDKRLQKRRGELMEHFAKAAMSGDNTATPLAAIQHWNEVNPARVIAPLHLQQSVARRAQRIAQSQQGVYLPGKRRDLLQEGRFAVEQE